MTSAPPDTLGSAGKRSLVPPLAAVSKALLLRHTVCYSSPALTNAPQKSGCAAPCSLSLS